MTTRYMLTLISLSRIDPSMQLTAPFKDEGWTWEPVQMTPFSGGVTVLWKGTQEPQVARDSALAKLSAFLESHGVSAEVESKPAEVESKPLTPAESKA